MPTTSVYKPALPNRAEFVLLLMVLAFGFGCASPDSSTTESPGQHTVRVEEKRSVSPSAAESAATIFYEVAERQRRDGNLAAARVSYEQVLARDPKHLEARLALAEIEIEAGQADNAIPKLKRILTDTMLGEPSRRMLKLRERAARLLTELNEVSAALQEAGGLLAAKGYEAELAGRDRNAMELYTQALRIWPGSRLAQEKAYGLSKEHDWPYSPELVKAVSRNRFISLDELSPTKAEVGSGVLLKNETKWGYPFANQGRTLPIGLWAPAPSSLTYDLDGRFEQFTARIFISSFYAEGGQQELLERELAKPGRGTVRFIVKGDGQTLYTSELVSYKSGFPVVEVPVRGVKSLSLIVTDGGDGNALDFAVWGSPRLHFADK